MAEHDDAQERTESATPKRLEKAREQGQVARSRDLNAAAVTVLSCAAISMFGERMAGALAQLMRSGLSPHFHLTMNQAEFTTLFGSAVADGFMAVLPVLATAVLAAILAPMTLSGWNFSLEALLPNFGKLNPIAGFGRVFSSNGLIELAKSTVKFVVVGVVAVWVLKKQSTALLAMSDNTLASSIQQAAHVCTQSLLWMSFGLLLLAAFDVPLQLWQFAKQLRMSREEIKQEAKEAEGSPELKGKIRRMQAEIARRRMMAEVPKADVIITNPTHYAVAIRYDERRHRAPIVVAKGVDEVAARIREIASENKVPLFEAPPLARVLYRSVELNQEIPASLYKAVAQVLTYIFQLRAFKPGVHIRPEKPVVEVQE